MPPPSPAPRRSHLQWCPCSTPPRWPGLRSCAGQFLSKSWPPAPPASSAQSPTRREKKLRNKVAGQGSLGWVFPWSTSYASYLAASPRPLLTAKFQASAPNSARPLPSALRTLIPRSRPSRGLGRCRRPGSSALLGALLCSAPPRPGGCLVPKRPGVYRAAGLSLIRFLTALSGLDGGEASSACLCACDYPPPPPNATTPVYSPPRPPPTNTPLHPLFLRIFFLLLPVTSSV